LTDWIILVEVGERVSSACSVMNESPAARDVDLSGRATKAVDLGASRRETDATTRRLLR